MGWGAQIALRSISVYVMVKITSSAKHRIDKAAELILSSRDAFRKMITSIVENGKEEGKVTHTFEFCRNAVANSKSCPRITGVCRPELLISTLFQTSKSMIHSRVSTNFAKQMIYPW